MATPQTTTKGPDFKKLFAILIIIVSFPGLTTFFFVVTVRNLELFGSRADTTNILTLVYGGYVVLQFISALILGYLSDRFGRRSVLIVSEIGMLLALIALSLTETLWLRLVLSIIIGALSGVSLVITQAIITDSTSEDTRTRALGLLIVVSSIGLGLGPNITSSFFFGKPAVSFLIFDMFVALSIAVSWFWLNETHLPKKRNAEQPITTFFLGNIWKVFHRPLVIRLLIILITQQVALNIFIQLRPFFTLNRIGEWSGFEGIILSLMIGAVQVYFIGRWSRRWGDRRLVYAGFAVLTLSFILIVLTPPQPIPWYSRTDTVNLLNMPGKGLPTPLPAEGNSGLIGWLWMTVAVVIMGIGVGVLQPGINSLLSKQVTDDERGLIMGTSVALLGTVNAVIFPQVRSLMFPVDTPSVPFIVCVVAMAIVLILTHPILPQNREIQVPPNYVST